MSVRTSPGRTVPTRACCGR